jgi:hypothetical protein
MFVITFHMFDILLLVKIYNGSTLP